MSARFVWTSSVYIVTVAGPTSRMAPKIERAAELLIDACARLEMSQGAKH
jgi:DNA-binding IclR family transcriptional regulator